MVRFSEEAVAAYELLVNKRQESNTAWGASPGALSGVFDSGDKWNSGGEETYSSPWVSQLEVAGHRGGLVAGSARQAQVWNTLLGTGGGIAGQTFETALDHRDRKGVFEHPLNKNQERTLPCPNQDIKDSSDSKRTYQPWTWRSQMESLREAEEEKREKLLRDQGPRKSILKEQKSSWEVSKVPRIKRVKLITPSDKQTVL